MNIGNYPYSIFRQMESTEQRCCPRITIDTKGLSQNSDGPLLWLFTDSCVTPTDVRNESY